MMAGIVVWLSVLLTLAFVAAWMWSAALRVWIERPKYRFLDDVRAYDRASRPPGVGKELTPP